MITIDIEKLKETARGVAANLRRLLNAAPEIATSFVTELSKKEEK